MAGAMRVGTSLVLALALACSAGSGPPQTAVIIVLDTARADRVASFGGSPEVMPHFAALAETSLAFDNAFAAAPWTLPSHATLFTGLEPHEHGCNHGSLAFDGRAPLLAEDLRRAGYATGGFSNNPWITASTGLAGGFDVYVEVFRRSMAAGTAINRFIDVAATGLADAGAARTVGAVDEWLGDLGGEPAFLFVNLIEAHLPYDPPAAWRHGFTQAEVHAFHDTWLERAHAGDVDASLRAAAVQLYDEELAYIDDRLGSLVEVLRRHGRLEESLLIVTSDHGEAFADARIDGVQLVDHQLSVRDELLRVPLLVRWPGVIEAGRSSRPVWLGDVRPLLLSATAGDGPTPELVGLGDADRVLRASYGPPAAHAPFLRRYVSDPEVSRALADRHLRAVRRGRYKLVVTSDGTTTLFDVAVDPYERDDIAAARPDVVRELGALLPPEPRAGAVEIPDGIRDGLDALGYTVGG